MNNYQSHTIKNRRILPEDLEYAAGVREHISTLCEICGEWREWQFSNLPQGYTYLGQLLMHEIVENKGKPYRSAKLDLDSIYGKEETPKDQLGRFLYCKSTSRWSDDLLRDPTSKLALIPEPRNDDHLIIAQIHLLIQKFHNRVIEALDENREYHANSELRFESAKKYVIACVQRIIFEEYLEKICDPTVYNAYSRLKIRIIDIDDIEDGLPYEMSHASLRYGHSQVRSFYRLNSLKSEVPLDELLELTGRRGGGKFSGIPTDFAIEWKFFFDTAETKTLEKALKINPAIIKEMRNLPNKINLVEKNLLAGVEIKLQSGQDLASYLINRGAGALGVCKGLKFSSGNVERGEDLKKIGLYERTPIWLYVLIEADGSKYGGHRLGPVGSIMLCEAVRNAISSEGKFTYPEVQGEFRDLPDISSMGELINFALRKPR